MTHALQLPQFERKRYELLLTVADMVAVYATLEAKRSHVPLFTREYKLYSRFASRADAVVRRLYRECAELPPPYGYGQPGRPGGQAFRPPLN